ncbi:MAG TPA: NAD/NADP octopine/nopaline dehydrogenase family protein [Bacteroidales bacterium]|nr:NAD/NADP octopine/nopaline dehydrogenase family protein [Bacteroidales bacterium]
MKVAVLGAGHGGQAIAGDLTLAGHEVRLASTPDHATNIDLLKAFGGIVVEGITSSGVKPGFAKIALITTDVAEAIRDARVIFVVIPAFGQETFMKIMVQHATPGQIIVFQPGYHASLVFARMLREAGREGELIFGDTLSLIFAAKTKGLGHVNIKAMKSELPFAALPSIQTAQALWVLSEVYPQLSPACSVLQTLDSVGAILHPVTTLLNMSKIEQNGPYRTSHYDMSPSVGRVMEAVDREKMKITKELGMENFSYQETVYTIYKVKAPTIYEQEMQVAAHNVQMTPGDLKHRYVTESVPYGLVPLAEFGKLLGIKTPNIDAIINLACMANGENYWEMGRNLSTLGIDHMSLQEIAEYITFLKRPDGNSS